MKHVACCSFGKDSLATVILAKKHNEPLDAVVYARVMYDKNRSAELPEHEDFIFNTAIPKLKSWGIETIDFVRKFYNKDYPEAMEYLLSGYGGTLTAAPPVPKEQKEFVLPDRNDNMRRVYAYLLHQRGLNRDVVYAFAHRQMIYESLPHHNAVFVGFDNDGVPRHAHKRGSGSQSTYKGNADGSTPEFSFHWNGTSNKIFLFEAPIDMLSYISMNPNGWQQHTYAASCSVADRVLFQCLNDNPNIKEVYLCLDNDDAGQKACKRISDKLFVQGYRTEILTPTCKDWNEDLITMQKEGEQRWETQLS